MLSDSAALRASTEADAELVRVEAANEAGLAAAMRRAPSQDVPGHGQGAEVPGRRHRPALSPH
jgi:hypothetical protein